MSNNKDELLNFLPGIIIGVILGLIVAIPAMMRVAERNRENALLQETVKSQAKLIEMHESYEKGLTDTIDDYDKLLRYYNP